MKGFNWILISTIVITCSLMLLFEATDETDAYPYNYDKDFTITHPGSGASLDVGHVHGQNISVTLWNFTQGARRTINIGFSHSNVYEFDPEWGSGSLVYSYTFGYTTKTIDLWCIMATAGEVKVWAYYTDNDVAGTFDIRIERSISKYSLDYEFRQNVTQRMDQLDKKVTYLNENISSLNENVTLLHKVTWNNTHNISTISSQLFFLAWNSLNHRNNITALWGNVDHIWQNVSTFSNDIEFLDEWRTLAQRDLANMSDALENLGFTIAGIGHAQSYQAEALLALQAQYDILNATLMNLTSDVEALKATGLDLSWIETNLTDIHAQIGTIHTYLEALPIVEQDVAAISALLDQAVSDIGYLDEWIDWLEDTVHNPYNDTVMLDRLAQLEGQNELLQDQLDTLEDDQDELQAQSPSAAVAYGALIIGVVALLVAIAVFLMKRKENPELWVENE